MILLFFKLVFTPVLMLLSTLVSRKWGETVGGLLVGLPLTSGPISLFLALEHGKEFAAAATIGSLTATIAQASFAVAYCRLARRGWLPALFTAVSTFAVVATFLQLSGLKQTGLFLLALPVMVAALRLMPRSLALKSSLAHPRWDIPFRILLIVLLVMGVTMAAPNLGAGVSGIIASFPFMAVILAVFAHVMAGFEAAQRVMRGLVGGLFSFAIFFWVLSQLLVSLSLTITYATAIFAALVVQFILLQRMRRQSVASTANS
ncbi:hypothetical protein H5A44_06090 [Pectobacterium brasiliense]|uniref:hypothetical protein n=1 Tax=Pectobacterium brasiliense TaxID=180957 RepID=UPI001969D7E6|nr:hypothetical protein [Pectobacterium brasiliense]MBN3341998.1 hypothetical protein [Pectobacterium brasiliense]